VQRLLALRAHLPELLSDGKYLPLTVKGKHAAHVVAFARRHTNAWAVIIVTHLAAGLLDKDSDLPLVDATRWEDTAVEMPADLNSRSLFDWMSTAAPKVEDNGLLLVRDALASMPVAVLVEDGVPRA
jgi:(1->4)-alpha-D-glucan 1-alpha-D-glucosylmutase